MAKKKVVSKKVEVEITDDVVKSKMNGDCAIPVVEIVDESNKG